MASTAPEVDSAALSAPLDGGSNAPPSAGPAAPAVPADVEQTDKAKKPKKGVKRPAKDLPLSKEEPQESLKPLPEDATGTRRSF